MKENLLVLGPIESTYPFIKKLQNQYTVHFIYHSTNPFYADTSRNALVSLGVAISEYHNSVTVSIAQALAKKSFKFVVIYEKDCIEIIRIMRYLRYAAPGIKIAVLAHHASFFTPGYLRRFSHAGALRSKKMALYARADLVLAETVEDKKILNSVNSGIRVVYAADTHGDAFSALHKEMNKPAKTPLTSIVIPCFNQLTYTMRCLKSIQKYTTVPYEIIMVNNASSDATAAYLKTVPGIKTITNSKNLGFAPACNQGMRRANGDFILILNNDTVATPHWLERMITCAQADPAIGLVGPRTNTTHGFQCLKNVKHTDSRRMISWAEAFAVENYGASYQVLWLNAFCLLIKRAVIDAVGFFDERFTMGGYEDYDYCLRARKKKYLLQCCGDSYVHHFGTKSYAPQDNLNNLVRNAALFSKKWGNAALEYLHETVWHSFDNILS